MKTKIIIIGGGIAGLTAAHELIDKGYSVTLFERNPIVGGLARTYQNEKNKICPIEYSWRAYGRWYQNVFHIQKQIPFNSSQTVFDQLVTLQGGKKTCDKQIINYEKTLSTMPMSDKVKLFSTLLSFLCSCKPRNIDNYSHISLRQFLKDKNVSKITEDLVGKIVGPYLGFDYHNSSLYDLLYVGEMMRLNSRRDYEFSITKYPTNYAWFDPWVRYLKEKGLSIFVNTEVDKIIVENNTIQKLITKQNNKYKTHTADYYINATGPEILEKLISPYRSLYPKFYNDINMCKINGAQIQLSVYYYINKKIFLDRENTLAYLPDSPWLLMILSTGHIWGDDYMDKYCDDNIKEIISVGICEPYVDGLLIKKPWSQCSKKEIEIEAWHQLTNNKSFTDNICIEDNTPISDIEIIDFKMWDSYKYDGKNMSSDEPKWANNVNTSQYRPGPSTPVNNLVLAGSYTDTSTGCYSMESACESGKLAATKVLKINNNNNNNIYIHKKESLALTKPIRYIDCLIYNRNNDTLILVYLIFMISIIIIILFIKQIT